MIEGKPSKKNKRWPKVVIFYSSFSSVWGVYKTMSSYLLVCMFLIKLSETDFLKAWVLMVCSDDSVSSYQSVLATPWQWMCWQIKGKNGGSFWAPVGATAVMGIVAPLSALWELTDALILSLSLQGTICWVIRCVVRCCQVHAVQQSPYTLLDQGLHQLHLISTFNFHCSLI